MPSSNGSMERVQVPIDDHSYLVTYNRSDTKIVIVFIHGIFGDYEETWKLTPVQLMTSQTLSVADWGSFGYGTKFIDFGQSANLVDQFVLWAKTQISRYEQIYLVAHSMGGLVVREACAKLVANNDPESHQLFSKIKRCFLIAVPISGAWAAKFLDKVPLVKSINWRIGYLAQPRLSRESIRHYDSAIRQAEKLQLSRPKFSLFVGTNDWLVGSAESWALTKDDEYEGPIPGNHDTVKRDLTVNSTLIKRIVQGVNSFVLPDVQTQKRKLEADYPAGAHNVNPVPEARARRQPPLLRVSAQGCTPNRPLAPDPTPRFTISQLSLVSTSQLRGAVHGTFPNFGDKNWDVRLRITRSNSSGYVFLNARGDEVLSARFMRLFLSERPVHSGLSLISPGQPRTLPPATVHSRLPGQYVLSTVE